jgi:hypothetical protein
VKLAEEAGEVTQAVIGRIGQNPCKGVTHTWRGKSGRTFSLIATSAGKSVTGARMDAGE